MKKLYITTLVACGFTLCSPASDLVWRPSSAVWDAVQVNWIHNISALGTAFTPGDNVIFDDGGNAFTQVKLVAGISAGTVLVDAIGDYTFTTNVVGGGISSLTSLTKRGSGKLIIETDNSFSGPTTIEGGVLQIGNGIARGTLGSSSITNNAGLVVSRTGILNLTNTLGGGGWLTNALAGTLQISGVNNMAGIISVNAGTLLLSNAPAAGSPTEVLINATVGTAGTRLLLAGGVTYPVGTTIRCLGTSSAANMRCNLLGNPGFNSLNGPIFCSGDGLVQVNGSGVGEFTVASSINANPADAVQFNGQLFLRGTGVGKLTGQVTLPGAFVNKTDAGSWTISSTGNSWSSTSLAVGLLRVGADNALPTTVALQMGQNVVNSALDLGGFNQQIATLNSAAGTPSPTNSIVIGNSSTTSDSVLTISSGGVFAGVIQDSISNGTRKVGLTITGGAQQLTTNCTYSGKTTILGGGLSLVGAGSIPNTATIDIATGAAVDVRSKSDATLALQAAQTLKGNGAFNVVGDLSSQGTIELKLDKTAGTLANDSIRSIVKLTLGGALKLVLSGDALSAGDSFKLFDATEYAGAFTSIVPANPGPGLKWNLGSLAVDGTISVEAGVSLDPMNITTALIGGKTQLQISWPLDHLGWTLQAQTNGLGTGLNSNWFDVPGSATSNEAVLPVDPANGSVFFRLRYQP